MENTELAERLKNTHEVIEGTIDALYGTEGARTDYHTFEWQCIVCLEAAAFSLSQLLLLSQKPTFLDVLQDIKKDIRAAKGTIAGTEWEGSKSYSINRLEDATENLDSLIEMLEDDDEA